MLEENRQATCVVQILAAEEFRTTHPIVECVFVRLLQSGVERKLGIDQDFRSDVGARPSGPLPDPCLPKGLQDLSVHRGERLCRVKRGVRREVKINARLQLLIRGSVRGPEGAAGHFRQIGEHGAEYKGG